MGQYSFNLIDQPWIPCITLEGDSCELSLAETLQRAHELREVFDASPLVTSSLYRLLIAVLHHNFGPKDVHQWKQLYEKEQFDGAHLSSYFESRRNCFDLFDKEQPFYQTSQLPFENTSGNKKTNYCVSISRIAHELASGNNATLFDHTFDESIVAMSPAESVRLLIAAQCYSMGGTHTFDEKRHRYAKASPLVNGAMFLVQGSSLFGTLMLNLHRYDESAEEPFAFEGRQDVPAWDRCEPTEPIERLPRGYLDLLTWQSRRIRLRPDEWHGDVVVPEVVIMKGEQFSEGFQVRGKETMFAFKKNSKPTKDQDPWHPLGFTEERVLWRDSLALLQSVADVRQRPKMIDWLYELSDSDAIKGERFPVEALGLVSDKAKVLLWRHERLLLHTSYLADNELLETLSYCLTLVDEVAEALNRAIWLFSSTLLLRGDEDSPSKEQKKAINDILRTLGAERAFWAKMNAPFQDLVVRIGGSGSADDRDARLFDAVNDWKQELRSSATELFNRTVAQEDTTAASLRSAAISERLFYHQLHRILLGPSEQAHEYQTEKQKAR